ncbi:hypothetical protein RSOLAG22IIIB_12852 [Rhizoctonia solani]|uniref:Jacalin-type lectin domain-containing protein n=1 Tax=Rhizoctonia solani TaxID=456999 RepID=A0A0K6GGS0_9AGAM|nr:hypothetical protein RSOLAG22IIIB_12852 [Rhizoctonia solani]
MSKLAGMPKLPSSVGGQSIPDFMNFEVCEDWEVPALGEVPEKWDFSIKKSPVYGQESGAKFDQGAVWYPLREVKFAHSDTGICHYQGHYSGRSTAPVGNLESTKSAQLKLNKEEHIVGFRAYSNNNVIEGVRVWTNDGKHKDFGKVQGPTAHGEDPEAFFVPKDHEVVNFFGHTNDDGHIHGLGASYTRRLASLRSDTYGANDPKPEIKQISSQAFMDAATQQQWSNNNMEPIIAKRKQAAEDVSPIYQNINDHDEKAWVKVRDPKTGEEYYLSWTENATCWAYVAPDATSYAANADTKNAIVSIGSYSKQSNTLGISGYIMNSLPATLTAAAIGMVFTFLVKPLIQEGITWGIAYAATKLAQLAAQAGVEAFAVWIPSAVASIGGLVVAGILGILVSFGALALMNVIWKKYWLVLNVYNFDADHNWSNLDHYSDNSKVSNGEWKTKVVDKFVKAGGSVTPPGFDPVEPMDNVVTYLAMTFENDSTVLQGLGEGVLMGREDKGAGMALKYVVHRFKDNEIGLKGIEGDPSNFSIKDFYNGGGWVTAKSIEVQSGNYKMTGWTPALGGDKEGVYTYEVNLGLPPPVTL